MFLFGLLVLGSGVLRKVIGELPIMLAAFLSSSCGTPNMSKYRSGDKFRGSISIEDRAEVVSLVLVSPRSSLCGPVVSCPL